MRIPYGMASRFNDQYYFPAECFAQNKRNFGTELNFNEDPYQYVVNPNDYLNLATGNDDPLRDTRINATYELQFVKIK